MYMDWDDLEHIAHLEREIEILQGMLEPSGTGHIHTAISVLETRVWALYARIIDDEKSA